MEFQLDRKSRPVIVIPYQERWPDEFLTIGQQLRSILADLALRIDHIGSTAIPGIAAKDIIDIQITVENIDDIAEFQLLMERNGYRFRSHNRDDHIPLDESTDPKDWQKRYFREPLHARRSHIHVREQGRRNQLFSLLFRDYLRAHPALRQAYEILKQRLAELFPDCIDRYLYIKDPAIDAMMISAKQWAKDTDWAPGPSDV